MEVKCPFCNKKFTPPHKSTGKYSQNNHAWGHAEQIAHEIGEDAREVLYEACRRAAPEYPVRMNAFGETAPKRWSEATKGEASAVIEELHRIAAFLSITLREGDHGDLS